MGKAEESLVTEAAPQTEEAASSLEDRARQRKAELEVEVKEIESLIDKSKAQLRKLQEAYLVKSGELVGLKKLLGE